MNYIDLLNFPVNYTTVRNVLRLHNLRKDVPNVVLRHDYDSLDNWYRILSTELMYGKISTNYLLVDTYSIPDFKQYEQMGFEFGLHQNFMRFQSIHKEITLFNQFGLELTSMAPHGTVDSENEYLTFNNWTVDEKFTLPTGICSTTSFYNFCRAHFGSYDTIYDVATIYSKTGKTSFTIPYHGILLLDDSGGWRKPYTEHNVLEHMDAGKVYVFLIHPSNMNGLNFLEYKPKWKMKWNVCPLKATAMLEKPCGDAHTAEQKILMTEWTAGSAEPKTSNSKERQQWLRAQQKYVVWANNRLLRSYIRQIITLGRRFQKFIGAQGRCLDIGCGNGLISGRSYKDIGYQYLDRGAIGIDPLILQGPKPPWIKEYLRAISENSPFRDSYFDTLVFATTLDHVENVDLCLEECRRVLKDTGTLNIWLTCRYSDDYPHTGTHANYFTQDNLEKLVCSHRFEIVERELDPWTGIASNGKVVASGITVFIKAMKRGD